MSSLKQQSKPTRLLWLNRVEVIIFILGCLLGAVSFACVYGLLIVNPLYDDWLFLGDMDLRQHYIGWCHFRSSDWHFPVGLIDSLSYPTSMSCIYTDSIPLFAVFFKLFRDFLPIRFQYFGIFGLVSFCLQGGISSILVFNFLKNKEVWYHPEMISANDKRQALGAAFVSVVASMFFVLSPTVLQRMFYHTALGAQWIILLALYIWIAGIDYSFRKKMIIYASMGILTVSIHSYYVPMVAMIIVVECIEGVIRLGRRSKAIVMALCKLGIFCVSAFLTLYILGGFYGEATFYGDGLGTFSANLNTFFNPLGDSKLFDGLPLYYGFQYEGFGYLGVGMLIMLAVAMIVAMGVFFVNEKVLGGFTNFFADFSKRHFRVYLGFCLFGINLALASFPIVAFNDTKVLGIPYPDFVRNFLGIFRSNGRFIWTAMYLLMLFAIVICSKVMERFFEGRRKLIKYGVIICALLIQLIDLSYMISYKHDYFAEKQKYSNPFINSKIDTIAAGYKEIAFLYNDNDIVMDAAFYAYLRGLRLNNFYYARNIDDEVNKDILTFKHELKNGIVRDDVIYICKKDDFDEEEYTNVKYVEISEHIVIMKQ